MLWRCTTILEVFGYNRRSIVVVFTVRQKTHASARRSKKRNRLKFGKVFES